MAPDITARRRWSPPGDLGLTVRAFGATDVGRLREHNEDAWSADPPVFVVADGMGGHSAGDVASAIVVEEFAALAGAESVSIDDVDQCIRRAQLAIDALDTGEESAPGSTLVVAGFTLLEGVAFWLIANVGDSRAYLWRGGELEQVSRDHSVVQELIDSGEIDAGQAGSHPERHIITRAIGALEHAAAEVAMIPIVSGARLLLCSDGLTSEVSDEAINRVLSASPTVEAAVGELIEQALTHGGRDNITALVIEAVGPDVSAEDTLKRRGEIVEDTVRTARR